MLRLGRVAVAVSVMVLCLVPSRAHAIPLTICFSASAAGGCSAPSSPTTTVAVGDMFSLYMIVDGAVDLNAWNMSFGDIHWSNSFFSLVSNVEGTFLRDEGTCLEGAPCSTNFQPGELESPTANFVTGMFGSLADPTAGATGTGPLAVFTFTALAATPSASIAFGSMFPGFGPFLIQDSSGNFFDPATVNASIQITNDDVSAVPESGTVLLVGVGVAAIALRRRLTVFQQDRTSYSS